MKDKLPTLINIATILGLAMGAYAWIDFKVDKAIVERVQPYESLLAGLSLIQGGSFELAIVEFRKVLDGVKLDEIDEVRLTAIIDPYLVAIANSERPVKYEADFQKLLPLIKNKTGLRGDRYNSVGSIYLFTNRPKKAIEAFLNSIAFYSMEKESKLVASSYWELCLSYLAIGELNKAIISYEKAWDIDHLNYGIENTYNYKVTKNDYGVQLVKMYRNFEPTISKFYTELNDSYIIEPVLKRDELKK